MSVIHIFFNVATNHHAVIFSIIQTNCILLDINFMGYLVNVISLEVENVKSSGYLPNVYFVDYKKETGLECTVFF